MNDKGLSKTNASLRKGNETPGFDDLVLDKNIFSNIFEKDIRRIYIYKKAERLAKALHLVGPAFKDTPALKERIERISFALVDASVQVPSAARDAISRELLALSSVLAIAKAGGRLSPMNADIILREAHILLQEVAGYEDPQVTLEEVPTLAALSRHAPKEDRTVAVRSEVKEAVLSRPANDKGHKGQTVGPKIKKTGRREEILAILKSKGTVYIKDISMLIRGVSEKTIQRELQALVAEGVVGRSGERRWTTYALLSDTAPTA